MSLERNLSHSWDEYKKTAEKYVREEQTKHGKAEVDYGIKVKIVDHWKKVMSTLTPDVDPVFKDIDRVYPRRRDQDMPGTLLAPAKEARKLLAKYKEKLERAHRDWPFRWSGRRAIPDLLGAIDWIDREIARWVRCVPIATGGGSSY